LRGQLLAQRGAQVFKVKQHLALACIGDQAFDPADTHDSLPAGDGLYLMDAARGVEHQVAGLALQLLRHPRGVDHQLAALVFAGRGEEHGEGQVGPQPLRALAHQRIIDMRAVAAIHPRLADQQGREAARLGSGLDHGIVFDQPGKFVPQGAAGGAVHRGLQVALDLARHGARRLAPVAPFEQANPLSQGGKVRGIVESIDDKDHGKEA